MIEKIDVNMSFGVIGALLGALIGDINGLLIALVVFMAVDYITGVLSALYRKKLNSHVGYKGIIGKAAILLVVILGNVIDAYIIQSGNVCRSMVILFYISNEGISIMENYCEMKLPFPEKLKSILEQMTKDEE